MLKGRKTEIKPKIQPVSLSLHVYLYNFKFHPAETVLCRPWVCVYVCVSTFSNIFSSETSRPIEAKFHVESPWDGGTKVCLNGPGHMTKTTDMSMYGKNLKKSSSPKPKDR